MSRLDYNLMRLLFFGAWNGDLEMGWSYLVGRGCSLSYKQRGGRGLRTKDVGG